MKNTGLFLGGLITGAVVGASLALLYAPQKGKDTRDQLKAKLKDMEAELVNIREKIKTKGGELKEEMKKKMTDLEHKIEGLIKEYRKNLDSTPANN